MSVTIRITNGDDGYPTVDIERGERVVRGARNLAPPPQRQGGLLPQPRIIQVPVPQRQEDPWIPTPVKAGAVGLLAVKAFAGTNATLATGGVVGVILLRKPLWTATKYIGSGIWDGAKWIGRGLQYGGGAVANNGRNIIGGLGTAAGAILDGVSTIPQLAGTAIEVSGRMLGSVGQGIRTVSREHPRIAGTLTIAGITYAIQHYLNAPEYGNNHCHDY